MNIEELKKYYKRHFGKKNILTAYELLMENDLLIFFLINSYNCYAIKHSNKNERFALSLITNPDNLFWSYEEKQKFIDDFKRYIIETVETKKYLVCEDNKYNECQDNRGN